MAFGGNPFQPLASPDSEGPKIEVEPDELEEVETENFGFLALKGDSRVRLFKDPYPAEDLPAPGASLFTVASRHGMFAAAGPSSFICGSTESLRKAFREGEEDRIDYTPSYSVPLPAKVSHVTFDSAEKYLLVGTQSGDLVGYNVADLANLSPGKEPTPAFEASTGANLREIKPNPAVESSHLVAVVTADGSFRMLDLNTKGFTGGQGNILKNNVTTVCWSQRGKQIICGLADGSCAQLKPDGTGTAIIPKMPDLEDVYVSSITWVDNHLFAIFYTKNPSDAASPSTDAECYLYTRPPTSTNPLFCKITDPTPPFGLPRQSAHQSLRIFSWKPHLKDMLLFTNTSSTDVGILLRLEKELENFGVPAGEFRVTTIANDARRAEVPMTEAYEATTVVGFALDLSAKETIKQPIAGSDIEETGPQPIFYILNSEGVLAGWHVIYSDAVKANESYPLLAINESEAVAESAAAAVPATPQKSTTSAFGAPSAFGTPSAFGSGNAFGNAQTPAKPAFGAPSTIGTPAFGQASAFGKPSAFGASGAFGSAQPSAPAFGTPSTPKPAFGTPSAIGGAGSSPFGKPAFGQPSAFGSPSAFGKPSVFGSPAPATGSAFGTSAASSASPFGSGGGFGKFASQGGFASVAAESKPSGSVFGGGGSLAPKSTEDSFSGLAQKSGGGGAFGGSGSGLSLPSLFQAAKKEDGQEEPMDKDEGGSMFGGGFGASLGGALGGTQTATPKDADMDSDDGSDGATPPAAKPTAQATGSVFGAPSTPSKQSIFGAPSQSTPSKSVFGAPSTISSGNVFGSGGAFGSQSPKAPTSVFGSSSTPKSAFGTVATEQKPGASPFGSGGKAFGSSGSAFGSGGAFGSGNSGTSAFGGGSVFGSGGAFGSPSPSATKPVPSAAEKQPKPQSPAKPEGPSGEPPLPPDPTTHTKAKEEARLPPDPELSVSAPLPPDPVSSGKKAPPLSDIPLPPEPPKFSDVVKSEPKGEPAAAPLPPDPSTRTIFGPGDSSASVSAASSKTGPSPPETPAKPIHNKNEEAKETPSIFGNKSSSPSILGSMAAPQPTFGSNSKSIFESGTPAPNLSNPFATLTEKQVEEGARVRAEAAAANALAKKASALKKSSPGAGGIKGGPRMMSPKEARALHRPVHQSPLSRRIQQVSEDEDEEESDFSEEEVEGEGEGEDEEGSHGSEFVDFEESEDEGQGEEPDEIPEMVYQDEVERDVIQNEPLEPNPEPQKFELPPHTIETSGDDMNYVELLEKIYENSNVMLNKLGTSAKRLAAFTSAHRQRPDGPVSLENAPEKWRLCQAQELGRILDDLQAQLNSTDAKREPLEEALQPLTQGIISVGNKVEPMEQLLHPPSSKASDRPLQPDHAILRRTLRTSFNNTTELIDKASRELTLLQTAIVSRDKGRRLGAAPPTVEAVRKTINKLTTLILDRSNDLEGLERRLESLSMGASVRGRGIIDATELEQEFEEMEVKETLAERRRREAKVKRAMEGKRVRVSVATV